MTVLSGGFPNSDMLPTQDKHLTISTIFYRTKSEHFLGVYVPEQRAAEAGQPQDVSGVHGRRKLS